ncbi:enoyl-CoA hydratase-related protein [Eilatimonas milleporae]|uniref:Enoyl-CoA hydratase n=1 Tax=Eilatimonas milleporae TaxID=911205 RepID=A0A3M0CCL5_9PROT|nr:enoyl-CoA hydratase-related protein [Eilatimonas milleporae]RMB04749.1 enoyl-CoA hydratase [Eilatimonas milleporae]
MKSYEFLQYSNENGIAEIHLNDPETLNAISPQMGSELLAAIERAEKEARVILLGAKGRAFCSGANLSKGGIDLEDPDRDIGARLETIYNPLILKLRDLKLPFVTAVRGAAVGVGCSIALMGDIIIASDKAYFLQAFCNIGLVPDGGSPYLLARAIGRVRAMELMLLGEKYSAKRAYADGLVTSVVEDDHVDSEAFSIAQRLAAGPTSVYALIKKSAWAALDSALDEQLKRERHLQRIAGQTDEFVEGVVAFREKRKANFQGTLGNDD